MFGTAKSWEPGSTIFVDYAPQGTVHWVEWQTSSPVSIGSFELNIATDGAPSYNRSMSGFALKWWNAGSSHWELMYQETLDPEYTSLTILRGLPTRITAQKFRGEFVQAKGAVAVSGPRIKELDGFYELIPEPSGTLVLGAGLAGMIGFIRRRR